MPNAVLTCQKHSKYPPNSIKMAIFFQKKLLRIAARIAQRLGALPPSSLTCHHIQNVKQKA